MATLNRTREGIRNQKKGVCVASALIKFDDFTDIAGVAELIELPEDALVIAAHLYVKIAFNAGTSMTLQLKSGSDSIFAAVSVQSTGLKATAAPPLKADTGVGSKLTATVVIVGALPTVGAVVAVVEYIEYNKNTGEYTDYSTT